MVMILQKICSVWIGVVMTDTKKCSHCRRMIVLQDFYMNAGKYRSECKFCTINRNVRYQKRVKAWRNRDLDQDSRRLYMRKYYEKNKDKYTEYRAKFKAKYPEYYKNYARRRKQK